MLQEIKSRFEKAVLLDKQGEKNEATWLYRSIINDHKIKHKGIYFYKAYSMFNLGNIYANCKEHEASKKIHRQLIEIFQKDENIDIKLIVAKTMSNLALNAAKTNEWQDSTKIKEKLVEDYQNIKNIDMKNIVLDNIDILCTEYIDTGDIKQVMVCSSWLINTIKDCADEKLQVKSVKTFYITATLLRRRNCTAEAIFINEKIVKIFKNSTNKTILEKTAKAMRDLILLYNSTKKYDKKNKTYNEFLIRFGESENRIIKIVAQKLKKYIKDNKKITN